MCFLGFSKSLPYTSHNHHFDYEMENCRYLASPGVLDARFGCTPYKVEAEASGLLTPTRTGWDPTGWFFPGKAGAVAIVARGLCTFAQKAGDLVEQFRLHRSLSREFYIYIYVYNIQNSRWFMIDHYCTFVGWSMTFWKMKSFSGFADKFYEHSWAPEPKISSPCRCKWRKLQVRLKPKRIGWFPVTFNGWTGVVKILQIVSCW